MADGTTLATGGGAGMPSPVDWNSILSWLTTQSQNNIGSVGGSPINFAGSSPISSILTGGLDIWSLITGQDRKNANTAINIADPLLPVQGTAQQQMAAFLADPGSVLKDPAFTEAEGVGAENVARLSGAAGMGNSGNKLADLFKFGQTAGLGFEQQKFGQLLQLLTGSPAAANISLGGAAQQNQTIGDLISSLFGGGGVPGLFNQAPNLLKLLGIGGGGGGGLPSGPPDNPGGSFWTPPTGSGGDFNPLPIDPTDDPFAALGI